MTLKDFYQDRFGHRETAVDTARVDLDTRRDELRTAEDEHAAALAATAANADDLAATRAALAAATTAADAEALTATLNEQIVESRKLRLMELDAARTLALARGAKERAAEALRTAERRLARAEGELAEAEELQERHDAWTTALGQPPLSTLAADAAALLAGPVFGNAEARLNADLPAKLRQRSAERLEDQRERLTAKEEHGAHAEDQLDARLKADGGLGGALAEAWTAFLRAEGALGDYVTSAAAELAATQAALEAIPGSPALTAEQVAELADASQSGSRDDAADAEKARDDALVLVEAKRREVDEARLEMLSGDPDLSPAQVDAEASVAALLSDLATLEGDLTTAEDALDQEPAPGDPTPREVLDLWETAAPESTWSSFAALEAGRAALTRLSADPAPLAAAMSSTEDDLAQALTAQDTSDRAAELVETLAAERAAAAAVARSQQGRRLAGQARGDA